MWPDWMSENFRALYGFESWKCWSDGNLIPKMINIFRYVENDHFQNTAIPVRHLENIEQLRLRQMDIRSWVLPFHKIVLFSTISTAILSKESGDRNLSTWEVFLLIKFLLSKKVSIFKNFWCLKCWSLLNLQPPHMLHLNINWLLLRVLICC